MRGQEDEEKVGVVRDEDKNRKREREREKDNESKRAFIDVTDSAKMAVLFVGGIHTLCLCDWSSRPV